MEKVIRDPQKLFNEIIRKKVPCYFISPHLDDAVLSAGGLISYLADKTNLTVINIFTSSGDGKSTLSARTYLRQCHSDSPERLYDIRIKEDKTAFSQLNLRVFNLGFTDALWRKEANPGALRGLLRNILAEVNALYPTYSFHVTSGKINKGDSGLEDKISNRLKEITGAEKGDFVVFCPVGFGNHVDHLIVRNACSGCFNNNLVYWSDFPYCLKPEMNKFIADNSLTKAVYKVTTSAKKQLSEAYKSQINQLVKDKNSLYKQEIYYLKGKQTNSFDIKVNEFLDDELLREWNLLWEKSPLRHYFNSSAWFLACQKAFGYAKTIFLRCYENLELVGILPLVLTKKYGVSAYGFPGNQYFDKAPVLLMSANTKILEVLISKLSTIGNYYLPEIEEDLLNDYYLVKNKVSFAKSSLCSFLPLFPTPYQYLRSDHKRKIIRKIEENQKELKFKVLAENIEENYRIMSEIEAESFKAKECKNILSDQLLLKLFLNLNKFKKGSFLTCLLYYKDEPICFEFGYTSGGTFHAGNTAYKTAYKELMPGKILKFFMLKEFFTRGLQMIDFSRGKSPLKRDLTPFFYQQYLIFYSSNFIVRIWWKALTYLKFFLEDYPVLFEIIRQEKKKFSLNILSLMEFIKKGSADIAKV